MSSGTRRQQDHSGRTTVARHPGTAEARQWLVRQVTWERTLSELRHDRRVEGDVTRAA